VFAHTTEKVIVRESTSELNSGLSFLQVACGFDCFGCGVSLQQQQQLQLLAGAAALLSHTACLSFFRQ
jgi:hypothetical protein